MLAVGDIVAILEDNGERISAMKRCMRDALPGVEIVFFEEAAGMIAWLGKHLGEVVLISLDHDLPLRVEGGKTTDCGTGRQVVDYLATVLPTCPVIVHSSNDICASGMMFALKEADWPCRQVWPREDLGWIAGAWIEAVQAYVLGK